VTTMLPWQAAHVEEARRGLGEDWWPYGLEPNRRVLELSCATITSRGSPSAGSKPKSVRSGDARTFRV